MSSRRNLAAKTRTATQGLKSAPLTGRGFFTGDLVTAVHFDSRLFDAGLRADTVYKITEMVTLGPGVWLNAAILQNVETKRFVQVSVSAQFLAIFQKPVTVL
jgi:hypothetical protein